MKISELITELKDYIEYRGDIAIKVSGNDRSCVDSDPNFKVTIVDNKPTLVISHD